MSATNNIHFTAVLIKNEWATLMEEVEICRDGFDEECVEKSIREGFWSVVNTFDGDITYKGMDKNFATQRLYNKIDEQEYQELKEEMIDDNIWSEQAVNIDALMERLKIIR